jgi:hypothetical protein
MMKVNRIDTMLHRNCNTRSETNLSLITLITRLKYYVSLADPLATVGCWQIKQIVVQRGFQR